MAVDEWTETQAAFVRYIEREGKGAKTVLANLGGCSTDTVDRFADGKEIVSSTFVKFRKALIQRGYLDQDIAEEGQDEYGPKTVALNFQCRECGKMTPGRPAGFYCMHCGELLGVICPNPNCSWVNEYAAEWCTKCNTPISEAVAKMAREIDQLDETPKERRKREDKAKELKRKDRKKRGIPEV